MPNAIESLLADHKLIRKLLEQCHPDHERFYAILKTLHRSVAGHAWFEDQVLLPALKEKPLLQSQFLDEIAIEHQHIEHLIKLVRSTPLTHKKIFEANALQLKVVLETHFQKEEEGLFPLAELILNDKGLLDLGHEMKRRQTEIRDLVKD